MTEGGYSMTNDEMDKVIAATLRPNEKAEFVGNGRCAGVDFTITGSAHEVLLLATYFNDVNGATVEVWANVQDDDNHVRRALITKLVGDNSGDEEVA